MPSVVSVNLAPLLTVKVVAALVVSELPYCQEWFHDGTNGVMVPVGDSITLAQSMVALCADADLRRSLGTAGRRLVEARADYKRCMDKLETVYRELLAREAQRKMRRPRSMPRYKG